MIKCVLGKAIAEARIQVGVTQEQLSSNTNINNRYLQKLEAGEQLPSYYTLFKLAEACETTPDKLIMPLWKTWIKKGCPEF